MDHSTTPTTEPATLNADQLDGLACITCGRDDQPMRPVDTRNGVQLFECVEYTRHLTAVQDAVALNPSPTLTNREAGLIFAIGSGAAVITADELGMDLREVGVKDVYGLMSAQEINEMVWFIRAMLGRRQAGAA